MAITKDKKTEILTKLEGAFKEASSVAFVGFNKLTVADVSKMRDDLRKNGVQYFVAKKTLIKKALGGRGYEGVVPELPGEVAVAWTTDDVTAPARLVHEYGKKLKGAVALLGGVFDGTFADKAGIVAIATIPPLQALRGMFANIINSPRQRFAVALGEVAKIKG
jgi:large subunit ribosomal protein L10